MVVAEKRKLAKGKDVQTPKVPFSWRAAFGAFGAALVTTDLVLFAWATKTCASVLWGIYGAVFFWSVLFFGPWSLWLLALGTLVFVLAGLMIQRMRGARPLVNTWLVLSLVLMIVTAVVIPRQPTPCQPL
jgi:hypothetical protein